jgi:hypothetical protein
MCHETGRQGRALRGRSWPGPCPAVTLASGEVDLREGAIGVVPVTHSSSRRGAQIVVQLENKSKKECLSIF